MQLERTCRVVRDTDGPLCRRLSVAIGSLVNYVAAGAHGSLTSDCDAVALEFVGRLREKALAVSTDKRCAYCVKAVGRHLWDQVLRREARWTRHRVSLEEVRTPAGDPVEFADPATDVFDQVLQRLPWKERLPAEVLSCIERLLDAREQEVLRLHFFEQLTHREIALRLGLNSARAANQICTRALAKINKHLADGGGVDVLAVVGAVKKIHDVDPQVVPFRGRQALYIG